MSENDHPDGRDEQDLDQIGREGGPTDDTPEEFTEPVMHLHSPAHGRKTTPRPEPWTSSDRTGRPRPA